jgi:hypothetical protein
MLKTVIKMVIPALIAGIAFAPRVVTAQGCNALYTLARASVSSAGAQANDESYTPTLSGDGRYVAYSSGAANLVGDDTNTVEDIFVYDRQTCQTERVSLHTDGTQSNDDSYLPRFATDGRRLVFESDATNLVSGDTLGLTDVFQRNVPNNQTERVSLSDSGSQANGRSFTSVTSADGRYVAFESLATNLTTLPDGGTFRDVFVRDRLTSQTELISISTTVGYGNEASQWAGLSDDGRYVVFESKASNLIANDDNTFSDIFIRDRETATTTRINGVGDTAPNSSSAYPAISANGQFVAFTSGASNLIAGGSSDPEAVFLYDRVSKTTIKVSSGVFPYLYPDVSHDGRFVLYAAYPTPAFSNDAQVYLYDRVTSETTLVSDDANGMIGNGASFYVDLSADGAILSFASNASNLVPNDTNNASDIFVLPRYVANGGNLLANGDFDAGFAAWGAFGSPSMGDIAYSVDNGVLSFTRAVQAPGVSNAAVVLQESGYPIALQEGLDATLQIGNASAVRKRITVLLHDSDFSDLQVCTFWLPPNAPLRPYRMTARVSEAWTNATLSIYASTADGISAYQVDNVVLKLVPPPTSTRTQCYDPDAPAAVGSPDSPNWIANGDFSAGFAGWSQFFAIQTQVTSGVLEFYGNGSPTGVAFQETVNAVPAGSIIEARFSLGSSAPRRRITVLLRDADFSDLQACTFWLAPNAALGSYAMRAYTTEAWTGASISFYPSTQGSDGWYRVDDVSLRARPSASITGTTCYPPGTLPAGFDIMSDGAPPAGGLPLSPTATPLESEGTITEGIFIQPGVMPEQPLLIVPTPMPENTTGEGTTTE